MTRWHRFGEGAYNIVYRSDDGKYIFKRPKPPLTPSDMPERAVRLWNEINPNLEPAHMATISRQLGWVCPFIEGDDVSDEEASDAVIDIFNRTGRIVIDAASQGNFKKTKTGQIVCVDIALALRISQEESPNTAETDARKSDTSVDIWREKKPVFTRFFSESIIDCPQTTQTIQALLFLRRERPGIKNADFMKENKHLINQLAQAYTNGSEYSRIKALDQIDLFTNPTMKLKVVFCEPPYQSILAAKDEKLIIIQSPYKIIQAELGDTRQYEKTDGSKMPEDFTYEQYCKEMKKLIQTAIKESEISRKCRYDQITIEGFSQPPNFRTLCSELEKSHLSCTSNSQILFENCSFGGKLYTDSASKLVRALQNNSPHQNNDKPLTLEIRLSDQDKNYLSRHDEARLALLKDVVVLGNNGDASPRPFTDDSLIGMKKTTLTAKLENPTFFYRETIQTMKDKTPAEIALKSFFSQEAQQQSDYTCGPATVKMVAGYVDSMQSRKFCGSPVTNQTVWHQISQTPEMLLAKQVNTSEAEGSDIAEIRNGLKKMGITVFDDNGVSNQDHDEKALRAHKELLWNKMHDILKMGIPVILNMQDRAGCGHFEVVIGIEKNAQGDEYIVLAEPGTALAGNLEFEHVPKDKFIDRWKNMSGEFHGRYMILAPNEASGGKIDTILADIPHCKNGVEIKNEDRQAPSSTGI